MAEENDVPSSSLSHNKLPQVATKRPTNSLTTTKNISHQKKPQKQLYAPKEAT